jgi:hypothetical protein
MAAALPEQLLAVALLPFFKATFINKRGFDSLYIQEITFLEKEAAQTFGLLVSFFGGQKKRCI